MADRRNTTDWISDSILHKTYEFSALKIPNIGKGGRWDHFEKAANASLNPWNGSEALKFIPGQLQCDVRRTLL
jgi:hypothetical protein